MSNEIPIEKQNCRSLLAKIILLVLIVSLSVVGWLFKEDVHHLWGMWSKKPIPASDNHAQFLPEQPKIMVSAPVSFEQQRLIMTFLQLLNEQLKLALNFGNDQAFSLALIQEFLTQGELLPKTPLTHELIERANILHNDIQATPTLDLLSTQALLNQLHMTLKQLPLNLHVLTTETTTQKNDQTAVPVTWFTRFTDKISNMVIIRHHQTRPEPLLSPTEQYYLTANLQLLVTQTEIALQTRNWEMSMANINLMREQLEHYFDLTSTSGQQCLKILGQLTTLIQSQKSEHQQLALQEVVKIGELLKIISQEVNAKERVFLGA